MLTLLKRGLFCLSMAIAVTFCIVPTSHGAPQCDTRENIIAAIAKSYHETPVAMGVTAAGNLLEILTNESGSTWSIILTTPEGQACLIGAGESWQALTQQKPSGPDI